VPLRGRPGEWAAALTGGPLGESPWLRLSSEVAPGPRVTAALAPWKLNRTLDEWANDMPSMRRVRGRDRIERLLRKEVIQPQVPLRLPCYDFTPVTGHSLGPYLLTVGAGTSGANDSHGVTGGVYKARERIHPCLLIRDY
jgi:hypothetical protein